MKYLKAAIMVFTTAVFLCGCQEKVITVADMQSDEEQEVSYIEMKEFVLKEQAAENGRKDVNYCAVMIPAGYVESEEIPGMYLHERAPLDSSNIYYTVSESTGDGVVSNTLTKDNYKKSVENAFKNSGQDIKIDIESFEEIDMEGVPGYKIRSTYKASENMIEQLTYLILAKDTYTITYSQADDDELMADFEISDGKIKLVKEESVEMAAAK